MQSLLFARLAFFFELAVVFIEVCSQALAGIDRQTDMRADIHTHTRVSLLSPQTEGLLDLTDTNLVSQTGAQQRAHGGPVWVGPRIEAAGPGGGGGGTMGCVLVFVWCAEGCLCMCVCVRPSNLHTHSTQSNTQHTPSFTTDTHT